MKSDGSAIHMDTGNNERKRRSDSAFGMHFDFHCKPDQTHLGLEADPVQIDRMLKRVKPDFVECDAKGHFGCSCYPTKIGACFLEQGVDILRMWRDVTAQNHVALYAHFSSLWEEAALAEHPDWGVTDENGVRSTTAISLFSPYLRERFIPQLIEIAVNYGLDGAWIDGDCWMVTLDYSPWARERFAAQYGREAPGRGSADFPEYLAFLRHSFILYVQEYCDAVHAAAPNFQICSNWYASNAIPGGENKFLDYLSADVSRLNELRLCARCFQQQKQPWDLMSWGFADDGYALGGQYFRTIKELPQLCQEAGEAISLGGGYQFVTHPILDHLYEWVIPRYERLAAFCRAREPFCFQAKPVPQACVFFSEASQREWMASHTGVNLLPTADEFDEQNGLLDLCLNAQLSTEILLPGKAAQPEALAPYGLIALPDLLAIEPEARANFLEYAREGGSLLLTGPHTLKLFEDALPIQTSAVSEKELVYLACEGEAVTLLTSHVDVRGSFRETGRLFQDAFLKTEAGPASFEIPFGKGRISALSFSVSDFYRHPTARLQLFFKNLLQDAWPNPRVQVNGSSFAEVALMEKNGKLCVNLLNTLKSSRFTSHRIPTITCDEIVPLTGLQVQILSPRKPSAIWLEPEHKAMDWSYTNGKITLMLDRLEIHAILVVEYHSHQI